MSLHQSNVGRNWITESARIWPLILQLNSDRSSTEKYCTPNVGYRVFGFALYISAFILRLTKYLLFFLVLSFIAPLTMSLISASESWTFVASADLKLFASKSFPELEFVLEQTHTQTEKRMADGGRADRRGCRNSYLD